MGGLYKFANSPLTREATPNLTAALNSALIFSLVQSLGLIGTFALDWDVLGLGFVFDFLAIFVLDFEILGLGCLSFAARPPSKILFKFLLVGSAASIYGVGILAKKLDKDKAHNSFMSTASIFFAALAVASVTPFNCYSGPDGVEVVQKYPGVKCVSENSEYVSLLIYCIIGFLFVTMGLFGYACHVVKDAPQKMQMDHGYGIRHRYAFVRFCRERYYWHPIFLLRGLCIAAPGLVSTDAHVQAYILVFVLLGHLIAVTRDQPWVTLGLNRFDTAALALVLLLIMSWFGFDASGKEFFKTTAGLLSGFLTVSCWILAGSALYYFVKAGSNKARQSLTQGVKHHSKTIAESE